MWEFCDTSLSPLVQSTVTLITCSMILRRCLSSFVYTQFWFGRIFDLHFTNILTSEKIFKHGIHFPCPWWAETVLCRSLSVSVWFGHIIIHLETILQTAAAVALAAWHWHGKRNDFSTFLKCSLLPSAGGQLTLSCFASMYLRWPFHLKQTNVQFLCLLCCMFVILFEIDSCHLATWTRKTSK